MDTSTTESSVFNSTNITCPRPLLWTQADIQSRTVRIDICIVASCIHAIFWLQVAFSSSLRQKSLQWIYAYLITDIFLLLRFFITYIIHTASTECEPSEAWILFVCYFDATVDNYFNILQSYLLLALNICRYIQIAYNKNVYRLYGKLLIATHLAIYLSTLISLVIQISCGWTLVDMSSISACQIVYGNIYIQVFNFITAYVLPIGLNILVIYISARRISLASSLQRTQHHGTARDKYNRSLVIQFLCFYIIWALLWSPNVIVFQIAVGGSDLTATLRALNFTETALDPIIIGAIDVRFLQAWKKFGVYLKTRMLKHGSIQRRIQPTTRNLNVFTVK